MATPLNAPMAGEIWHLSIEDLFQPVQEASRLGGEGPFVINLSVSTAPISLPTKSFTSRHSAHVYQIQVTEDGRTRYRLRLGPFTTEDEADAILAEVRDTYPGALTATAGASDLRAIGSVQAKAEQRQSAQRPAEAQRPAVAPKPDGKVTIDKAAAQKIAAQKFAVPEQPATLKADPEISIDIAWPIPDLAVPPVNQAASTPTAPPTVVPPSVVSAPPPQLTLPELDIPFPTVPKRPTVQMAPVLTEAVAPASKAAPKIAEPLPILSLAPVLTEVVLPTRTPASKAASQKPTVIAEPVLTEAVPPKKAAPIAPAPIAPAPSATASTTRISAPPTPVVTAPVARPPKATAPIAPAPAVAMPAAPVKHSPVLTQSTAPPRKSFAPKFRAPMKAMASRLTSLQHVVVATAPAPAPREVKKLDRPLESLESTQTIRALTPMELEDEEASRWFVIELAQADTAFDPDAVPNLDLFSEYRLYSVAGEDQGRVVHTLRLGFFREEIGAVAVASYLGAYWEKPTIKRVSVAERQRFADQRVEARKDVGATGRHAVIEITDELVARRKRSSKLSASTKPSDRSI
jgi:SPOR domain